MTFSLLETQYLANKKPSEPEAQRGEARGWLGEDQPTRRSSTRIDFGVVMVVTLSPPRRLCQALIGAVSPCETAQASASGSATTWFLPPVLARYIAASARRSRSEALPPGSEKATPIEAPSRCAGPATRYSSHNRARMRSATTSAPPTVVPTSSTITN